MREVENSNSSRVTEFFAIQIPVVLVASVHGVLLQSLAVHMQEKHEFATQMNAKQRRTKAKNQKFFRWTLVNGKQVRVERNSVIDGFDEDEFLRANPDPIQLHKDGRWDILDDLYNSSEQAPDGEGYTSRTDDSKPDQ